MFELTINGEVYQFNFGIGFVREINRKIQKPVDGVPGAKEDVGLAFMIAQILDGDIVALVDILEAANKGRTPRITKAELDKYVDDENTDIDQIFEDVINFFLKANATKKVAKKMKTAFEEEAAKN